MGAAFRGHAVMRCPHPPTCPLHTHFDHRLVRDAETTAVTVMKPLSCGTGTETVGDRGLTQEERSPSLRNSSFWEPRDLSPTARGRRTEAAAAVLGASVDTAPARAAH